MKWSFAPTILYCEEKYIRYSTFLEITLYLRHLLLLHDTLSFH